MAFFWNRNKAEERTNAEMGVGVSDSLLTALLNGTDVDKTILLQIPAVRGCTPAPAEQGNRGYPECR